MKTLSAIALIIALAIATTVACASNEADAPPPAPAVPTASAIDFQIGNNIGNRIPDFDITLTDGTPVTASLLLERERPAFLFFFGTT